MKKFLTSITFLFLVLFLPTVAAQAADGTQTAQTQTTVTISWTPASDALDYEVYLFPSDADSSTRTDAVDSSSYVAKLDTAQTSYTFTGLKASSQYIAAVYYNHLDYYGNVSDYKYSVFSCMNIKTTPKKVTGVNQQKWWYFIESVDATWNRQPGVDGYEYAFFNSKNKKVYSDTTYNPYDDTTKPSGSYSNAKNSNYYYVKVRAYQNLGSYSEPVYLYGPWSSKAILFTQPMVNEKATKVYTTTKKTKNGKKVSTTKMSIKWDKVSGMDKYQVYVSTKEKSGYKLVKTVNGKTTSATITKLGKNKIKKNKTYYVYVVGIKKVDGKTYTSGRHYTVSVKNSTTNLNWTFDN